MTLKLAAFKYEASERLLTMTARDFRAAQIARDAARKVLLDVVRRANERRAK